MSTLRKPGSHMPQQQRGGPFASNNPISGPGSTRSCDRCLTHGHNAATGGKWLSFPPAAPGLRPVRKWYCAGCIERRAQRQREKNLPAE